MQPSSRQRTFKRELQYAPALTVFDHEDANIEPTVNRELADNLARALDDFCFDGVEIIQNNAFFIYRRYKASRLRETCGRQLADAFSAQTGAKDQPRRWLLRGLLSRIRVSMVGGAIIAGG